MEDLKGLTNLTSSCESKMEALALQLEEAKRNTSTSDEVPEELKRAELVATKRELSLAEQKAKLFQAKLIDAERKLRLNEDEMEEMREELKATKIKLKKCEYRRQNLGKEGENKYQH